MQQKHQEEMVQASFGKLHFHTLRETSVGIMLLRRSIALTASLAPKEPLLVKWPPSGPPAPSDPCAKVQPPTWVWVAS